MKSIQNIQQPSSRTIIPFNQTGIVVVKYENITVQAKKIY